MSIKWQDDDILKNAFFSEFTCCRCEFIDSSSPSFGLGAIESVDIFNKDF